MRNLRVLILLCLTSCGWEEYPPEKYVISQQYRDLISSYEVGDTIKFKDSEGHLSSFLIEKIDSFLLNKRGHFINQAEHKSISIACREIENARQGYEEYNMISIIKDPKTDSTGFDIRLKDFYGIDITSSFVLRKDTITANNLSFTNYYSFRPYDYTEQKNPNSISEIYMTNQDGIIAYKSLNGFWWTKVK